MDFKAPRELSKAIPGKFHGSGRHTRRNSLRDQANFHWSQAWQIVLIFTTAYIENVSLMWEGDVCVIFPPECALMHYLL